MDEGEAALQFLALEAEFQMAVLQGIRPCPWARRRGRRRRPWRRCPSPRSPRRPRRIGPRGSGPRNPCRHRDGLRPGWPGACPGDPSKGPWGRPSSSGRRRVPGGDRNEGGRRNASGRRRYAPRRGGPGRARARASGRASASCRYSLKPMAVRESMPGLEVQAFFELGHDVFDLRFRGSASSRTWTVLPFFRAAMISLSRAA